MPAPALATMSSLQVVLFGEHDVAFRTEVEIAFFQAHAPEAFLLFLVLAWVIGHVLNSVRSYWTVPSCEVRPAGMRFYPFVTFFSQRAVGFSTPGALNGLLIANSFAYCRGVHQPSEAPFHHAQAPPIAAARWVRDLVRTRATQWPTVHRGIKCTPDWTGGRTYHDDDKKNDCFRKYKNAAQSYEDHAAFLQKARYASLFELKSTDYQGWAKGLKKAGYATDPNYPSKLITLIERYELHNLDRGVDVAYKPAKPSGNTSTRSTSTSNPNSSQRSRSEGQVITFGTGRSIEQFEGRIKFVRAKEGESFRDLAQQLEMTHGMIARWNDMDKNSTLKAGQVIYIQPKRNAAKSAKVHTGATGETLWDVSQKYGVKLARLSKFNGLPEDTRLSEGQQVLLRKAKK